MSVGQAGPAGENQDRHCVPSGTARVLRHPPITVGLL
jgi:hypothetical protein